MRRIPYGVSWAASLAAMLIVTVGVSASFIMPRATIPDRPPQPADVEVMLDSGHGSAVHIGDGYYLTAGHVAAVQTKKLTLKTHDGAIRPAEVLWVNKERDIALLKAGADGIETAKLSCKAAAVGDDIILKGNPTVMEFITSTGKIAGAERKLGFWRNIQIVDASVLPGQSGGPVYNVKGELVGITVGVATFGQGFVVSPTGYGMIVPGNTLCELLARK